MTALKCASLAIVSLCVVGCHSAHRVNTDGPGMTNPGMTDPGMTDPGMADPGMAELIAIQHADPAAALAAAWKRGDREFLAVRGFSTEIVGVDGPEYEAVVYDQGVRVISGTSDTPSDARHAQLIQGAREYAGRYNRLLLQRLGRGGHVEPSAASPEPGTPHPAPPAEGE